MSHDNPDPTQRRREESSFLGTYGSLLLMVLSGALMAAAAKWGPQPGLGDVLTAGLALAFAGCFMGVLVKRLKRIYAGHYFWVESLMAGGTILLALLAFAVVYSLIGVRDTTGPGGPGTTTQDYFICLYLSVVTFTTLGYGDFVPLGAGRGAAAVQAFTGWLVLALAASTAAGLIQQAARSRIGEEGKTAVESDLRPGQPAD